MKITLVQVRPSQSVSFFKDDDFVAYLTETYLDTGKLTVVSTVDKLTKTVVIEGTRAACTAFKNDPLVIKNRKLRDAHNAVNGISIQQDV